MSKRSDPKSDLPGLVHPGPQVRPISARLVNVHLFTAPPQRVMSRRRHEPAELMVVIGGVYKAFYDTAERRESITAQVGQVVYWPERAERLEENDPERPMRCIGIYFKWPAPPRDLPYVVRDRDHLMDLLAYRLLAVKTAPAHPDLAAPVSQAYLNALLAEYVHQAYLSVDSLVARVIRFTEEHIAEPFTLGALARHVGLEKHHFGRKYKTLTGHTPMPGCGGPWRWSSIGSP